MTRPDWLRWAETIRTIASAGLTYADDPFDLERYRKLDALALEMLAARTDLAETGALDVLRSERGYVTPKVDVRAAVFDARGRVLMVREVTDGCWSLPGGWADVGESAAEIAVREAREESGYEVRAVKLIALLDKAKHPDHPLEPWYVYKAIFRCELTGGAAAASAETEEVGWFARDALPPLSVRRNTGGQLALVFRHLDEPDRPADFD